MKWVPLTFFQKHNNVFLIHQEYYEHYVLIKGGFLISDTTLKL